MYLMIAAVTPGRPCQHLYSCDLDTAGWPFLLPPVNTSAETTWPCLWNGSWIAEKPYLKYPRLHERVYQHLQELTKSTEDTFPIRQLSVRCKFILLCDKLRLSWTILPRNSMWTSLKIRNQHYLYMIPVVRDTHMRSIHFGMRSYHWQACLHLRHGLPPHQRKVLQELCVWEHRCIL